MSHHPYTKAELGGELAADRRAALRLPGGIEACMFDLDGVLTDTARIHAEAWARTFDAFLAGRRERPFDRAGDYESYVDGRPRSDGVRTFLVSRDIAADDALVDELASRKDARFLRLLEEQGIDVYPGSLRFVRAARRAGMRTAVVSSSANAAAVLKAASIDDLFDARVDGVVIEREHLRGKPAPDAFLAGARALDVVPAAAAVFEDALAGVAAGRAGGFGHVVGVDRAGRAAQLRAHGADAVVGDLGDLVA